MPASGGLRSQLARPATAREQRFSGSGDLFDRLARTQAQGSLASTDLDPDSMRGPGARSGPAASETGRKSARGTAHSVCRDTTQAAKQSADLFDHQRSRERPRQDSGGGRCHQEDGLQHLFMLDATRSLRRFFAVLDLFLGIFGSLALAVASIGIVKYAGHGDSGTTP